MKCFPINYSMAYIASKVLRSPPWLGSPLWNICVTNDHGYIPLVAITSRSFPHSWLLTGFASRLTRRLPLVEQELLTLPELLSSTPVFSGIRVTRSLVLWVCFVDRCLPFLATVLSVLRFTDSDYTFGIFKLLLYKACRIASVWRNFHFVVLCVFIQEIIHGIHSLFQRF